MSCFPFLKVDTSKVYCFSHGLTYNIYIYLNLISHFQLLLFSIFVIRIPLQLLLRWLLKNNSLIYIYSEKENLTLQ
jgi:hypothetical protein